MNKTLILKEIHDLRYVLAIAGMAIFILITSLFGFTVTGKIMGNLGYENGMRHAVYLEDFGPKPPFIYSGGYIGPVTVASSILAIVLGGLQGLHEQRGGRWQFLLSLPVTRTEVILAKILTGMAIWLSFVLILVGTGIYYSAIPDKAPYPLEWWVIRDGCLWIPLGMVFYFSSLFSGLRKARWFGTRLLPLLGYYLLVEFLVQSFALIKSHWSGQLFLNPINSSDNLGFTCVFLTSLFISIVIYFQIQSEFQKSISR
jgi:hypothetical protein